MLAKTLGIFSPTIQNELVQSEPGHGRVSKAKAPGIKSCRCRRHHEQDTVLAPGDGLDRRIHRVDLVVARCLAAAVVEIVPKYDLLGVRCQSLSGAIAFPQIGRRRKGIKGEVDFGRATFSYPVVEYEAVAIRGEHEGDIECRGVFETLLHPIANAMGIILDLDDRKRQFFHVGCGGLTAARQYGAAPG